MKPDLDAEALEVAVQVVNELRYSENHSDRYGWLGNPTWELNHRSKKYSDEDPYYSIKIRFEEWRLKKGNIDNIVDYLQSVNGLRSHDYYFSHDQPFSITLELPAKEGDNAG